MIQVLFEFPLPNNGDRYDLSKEELVELLQKAYENGRQSNQTSQTVSSRAWWEEATPNGRILESGSLW